MKWICVMDMNMIWIWVDLNFELNLNWIWIWNMRKSFYFNAARWARACSLSTFEREHPKSSSFGGVCSLVQNWLVADIDPLTIYERQFKWPLAHRPKAEKNPLFSWCKKARNNTVINICIYQLFIPIFIDNDSINTKPIHYHLAYVALANYLW